MDRYRTTGALDDPSLNDGDGAFIGTNDFDAAENLQSGQCQAAVNKSFQQANADTRGGFICHPYLGNVPFAPAGTWTSRNNPGSSGGNAITFGNGLFVATLAGTEVITSQDGMNWALRTCATGGWNALTYGNSLFVAVGGGATNYAMSSPDGVTWTARTLAAGQYNAVTYGGGTYVALGGTPSVGAYSTNGTSWTASTLPAGTNFWSGVAYGNSTFVAVASSGTVTVMTSTDGITWTSRTGASGSAIAYGRGTFVVVGVSGTAYTSSDGITWTSRSAASTSGWVSVAYYQGLFVAVSNSTTDTRVMTSPDGITWTLRTPATTAAWQAVAGGGGLFAALASAAESPTNYTLMSAPWQNAWGYGVYSDPNDPGGKWTVMAGATSAQFVRFGDAPRTISYPTFDTSPSLGAWVSRANPSAIQWRAVAYSPTLTMFAAVSDGGGGGTGTVMTSSDVGATWTAQTGQNDNWNDIVWARAGKFVAVGGGGVSGVYCQTSTDGVTWTARTIDTNTWNGVTYSDTLGLYIAVASSGASRVATSGDGITWTARTAAAAKNWQAVAYGNGVAVAVSGTSGTANAMYSTTGATWTASNATPQGTFTDIAFGNGVFVAVGNTDPCRVMTSTDGISWTPRTPAQHNNWQAVTFANGLFVAVAADGTSRVMTSVDGITWTAQTAAAANQWVGVGYGANTVVALSADGSGNRIMAAALTAGTSYVISQQATVVQANNYIIIMAGDTLTPIRWSGDWSGSFSTVPNAVTTTNIPHSNHATYYVNRLWVKSGKDLVAASDALDFTEYNSTYQTFNTNIGTSDYVVCTYPFGVESLLVMKNQSIQLLQSIAGALSAAVATEVTRFVGIVGINAIVGVGPDLAYISDRNVNLISLTATNNSVQHKTEPLSRNIKTIMQRVNWNYGYKISLGYWDNKLYVALPLDNATVCNTIAVYNFVTEQWWGEWNFAANQAMAVQGFVLSDYNGATRLHCITEDGRVFITDGGPQDITGTILSDISDSVTTRAYRMDNNNRFNRRLYLDMGTNRPSFTVVAYVDGASESETVLSAQTFSRSNSWIFNDSTYSLTNSGDNYNRAGRKDYAGLCSESVQPQSGFYPEMLQEYRLPLITRRCGRLTWAKVSNTQGRLVLNGTGFEARAGARSSLIQVI